MFIERIIWETTHACNLDCMHCVGYPHSKRESELTLQERCELIPGLKELGIQYITFGDGEPFMDPDLLVFSRILKENGFNLGLLSNGTLINGNHINKMAEIGFEIVGLSIDGTKDIHDRMRRKVGVYESAMTVLKLLKEAGLKVAISTCVNNLTIKNLPELGKILSDMKVDEWQLMCLIKQDKIRYSELYANEMVWKEMVNFVEVEKASEKYGIPINIMDCLGTYAQYESMKRKRKSCEAGRTSFGIQSDGKIKGCFAQPNEDDYIIGDLRKQSLKEIMQVFESELHKYSLTCLKYCKGSCNTSV